MPSSPTHVGANATAPVETDESGAIRVAETTTKTIVKKGQLAQLQAILPAKGSITSDGYRIITADLKPGAEPTLTIVQEPVYVSDFPGGSGGAAFPPDQITLKAQKENIPLERHYKFIALTAAEKAWWNVAFGNGDADSVREALDWFELSGIPSADALAFFDLKRAGNDTFPLAYWNYTWTHHDSMVAAMSDGEVIETPYGPGAPYLGRLDQAGTERNGTQWKREPDELSGEEGHWVISRSWIGYPTRFITWSTFLMG